MFQPGQDFNYPTSSGDVKSGLLAKSFTFQGLHLSCATIAIIVAIIVAYQYGKGRR